MESVLNDISAHPLDTSLILPTELRWSHTQAEYAGVHNNNLPVMPALNAFSQVRTNMRLTDAISVSSFLSTPASHVRLPWSQ